MSDEAAADSTAEPTPVITQDVPQDEEGLNLLAMEILIVGHTPNGQAVEDSFYINLQQLFESGQTLATISDYVLKQKFEHVANETIKLDGRFATAPAPDGNELLEKGIAAEEQASQEQTTE